LTSTYPLRSACEYPPLRPAGKRAPLIHGSALLLIGATVFCACPCFASLRPQAVLSCFPPFLISGSAVIAHARAIFFMPAPPLRRFLRRENLPTPPNASKLVPVDEPPFPPIIPLFRLSWRGTRAPNRDPLASITACSSIVQRSHCLVFLPFFCMPRRS